MALFLLTDIAIFFLVFQMAQEKLIENMAKMAESGKKYNFSDNESPIQKREQMKPCLKKIIILSIVSSLSAVFAMLIFIFNFKN